MLRKILIVLSSIFYINGCTVPPPTPQVTDNTWNLPFGTTTLPMALNGFNGSVNNVDNLDNYVDQLNWDFNYIFAYVQVVNEFAKTKGYRPPNTTPICKLVLLPSMNTIPQFKPSDQSLSAEDFERELTNYILQLKNLADDDRTDMDQLLLLQRYLCIY